MQPDQDTSLAATVDAPPGWRSRFDSRNMLRWESGLAVAVIAIGILGVSTSSEFLTGNNIFNLGLQSGEIAIMALPMTLIIISGEIDLSVASIMGMSSAVLGYLWGKHWSMLVIFVVILLVGAVAGWLMGKVLRGNGFGLVGDAAVGVVGALIGDWLLPRLNFHFWSGLTGMTIDAAIGAVVLLVVLRSVGASGWGGAR